MAKRRSFRRIFAVAHRGGGDEARRRFSQCAGWSASAAVGVARRARCEACDAAFLGQKRAVENSGLARLGAARAAVAVRRLRCLKGLPAAAFSARLAGFSKVARLRTGFAATRRPSPHRVRKCLPTRRAPRSTLEGRGPKPRLGDLGRGRGKSALTRVSRFTSASCPLSKAAPGRQIQAAARLRAVGATDARGTRRLRPRSGRRGDCRGRRRVLAGVARLPGRGAFIRHRSL
mmetsp:Transcript_18637/g.64152  ORF Transcript_18637/g.64152 Transcript_18637/m.64152 type:complete len:232 (-) Transcript_18637:1550-2245(-)